jgi:putative nucleotidyltransferase with HDIG domain
MSDQKKILGMISNLSSIPTLPSIIRQIINLLQNPKTSVEELGRAIASDQALAAKVLKLVNSAFYGFPGRISTINHAIVILGFSTIKNVVLTASILDMFRKKSDKITGFDIERFWMHSISCGAAAKSIARFTNNKIREECFIAGLIHDVGKILLYQHFPDLFMEIYNFSIQNKLLFYQSELQLFKITHQEIGGALAEKWNLPQMLQQAIKYHHAPHPNQEYFSTTSIVHCADILVRALDFGYGGDDQLPNMSEAAWKCLNLDSISSSILFDMISDEIEKATLFIQLS